MMSTPSSPPSSPSNVPEHPSVSGSKAASVSSASSCSQSLALLRRRNRHQKSPSRKYKRRRSETSPILTSSSSSSSGSTSSSSPSSSSGSSSSEEEDESSSYEEEEKEEEVKGWRVKLYRLNADGSWDDCGTGRISVERGKGEAVESSRVRREVEEEERDVYRELGFPSLCMLAESSSSSSSSSAAAISLASSKVLLQTLILLREAYQRQGDNIITWCEPQFESLSCGSGSVGGGSVGGSAGGGSAGGGSNSGGPSADPEPALDDGSNGGVDLALSFQDNAGCLDIWRQITEVQSRASALLSSAAILSKPSMYEEESLDAAVSQAEVAAAAVAAARHAHLQHQHHHDMCFGVVNKFEEEEEAFPKGDGDAEAAAVTMAAAAAAAMQQPRNSTAGGTGTVHLATPTLANLEETADRIAAAQIQQREPLSSFLSNNDCAYMHALLQLFPSAEKKDDIRSLATLAACIKSILLLNDPTIIELIATKETLFENVCSVLEYDPDLRVKANHRWFIRERAKFRTVVKMEDEKLIAAIHRSFRVTYLRDTLLRPTMDESSLSTLASLLQFTHAEVVRGVTCADDISDVSQGITNVNVNSDKKTKTHRDCYLVKILRMLGKEVDMIQQLSKDPRNMKEEQVMEPARSPSSNTDSNSIWKQHLFPQDPSLPSRKLRRKGCLSFLRELFNMVRSSLQQSAKDDFYAMIVLMDVHLEQNNSSVNLLSLLGAILVDSSSEVAERSASLDILSAIAMHDAGLIRRHCLDGFVRRSGGVARPKPNDAKEVVFTCGNDDLLLSLLYLTAVETDAGLLLQTSEIMRIILDTEMMEQGPLLTCIDDESPPATSNSDPNSFLQMFYEHYAQWLIAPFQYTILSIHNHKVPPCAIRSSFAVELLCFCVRAHCYRMKIFILRNRVLASVLNLLRCQMDAMETGGEGGGERCLKLAALRFLRSVLSVKDEFYHRHIMQYNLFAPVFDAFRANPVGDNLVSSAIIEMCDFIRTENIKSLLEHIVTKHLSSPPTALTLESASSSSSSSSHHIPTLEDVATPYVDTLTLLRKKHEENLNASKANKSDSEDASSQNGKTYYEGNVAPPRRVLSQKAMEDQRKFRESDEEDSYFNADDEDDKPSNTTAATQDETTSDVIADNMSQQQTEMQRARQFLGLCSPPSSMLDRIGRMQQQHQQKERPFRGMQSVHYHSSSDEEDEDMLSHVMNVDRIENTANDHTKNTNVKEQPKQAEDDKQDKAMDSEVGSQLDQMDDGRPVSQDAAAR